MCLTDFCDIEKNGASKSCCLVWLKGNYSRIFKKQLWTSTARKPIDEIKPKWIHCLYFNFVSFGLGYIMYIYLKMIIFSIVEWRSSNTDIIRVRNCRYSCCCCSFTILRMQRIGFLFIRNSVLLLYSTVQMCVLYSRPLWQYR